MYLGRVQAHPDPHYPRLPLANMHSRYASFFHADFLFGRRSSAYALFFYSTQAGKNQPRWQGSGSHQRGNSSAEVRITPARRFITDLLSEQGS